MAKIFRTETLNLGGNLRLEASSAGAFEIKSADGSTTHMSRAGIETDVSSLQAVDVANESDLSVDVSSLHSNNSDQDTDISSLHAQDQGNDVVAKSEAQDSGAGDSGSIAFGRTFGSTPAVMAVLKSTTASDPIIACMVTAVSETACTVSFADDLPSANYTVELFASLAD